MNPTDRLELIKQSPRQAGVDDVEWLCEEVERLQAALGSAEQALRHAGPVTRTFVADRINQVVSGARATVADNIHALRNELTAALLERDELRKQVGEKYGPMEG